MTSESARLPGGVLDTCAIIDVHKIPGEAPPIGGAVATITLAELGMGAHLTTDQVERPIRVTRLISAEANFDALPFDVGAARAYSNLLALMLATGRNPKPRKNDLVIAATAVVNGLPLCTRNPDDFKGLESQLTVVPV